jgi:hypothetical protein
MQKKKSKGPSYPLYFVLASISIAWISLAVSTHQQYLVLIEKDELL